MTEDNTDYESLLEDFECDECGETLEDCQCDSEDEVLEDQEDWEDS